MENRPTPNPTPSGDVPARQPAAGGRSSPGMERTIRALGRGTAVMMVATIVLVALQFLVRVIIVRHVSSDEWGEFNLGLALTSFLALVTAFGIPTATARSLAFEETSADRWRLIRNALYVSLPVAVVSSVLVYLFAPNLAGLFHDASLAPVFRLFAVSVGLTMLSNVLVGFFQGLERAEPNAIFLQIVNPSLFLAFAGLLILLGWGLTGVIVGYALSWAGALAGLGLYTARRLPPLLEHLSTDRFTGDASARVSFVALSVTLFGVTTLAYLTSYADTILLGVFAKADIVGNYSSAMNLTRLLLVGSGTVTFIYLPVTSRLRRERNFEGLRSTYVTVTRWMALLTLPLTFIFVFDPVYSLAFTFGPNQVAGAAALRVLVATNTISLLIGPSTSTLGGLGETRQVLLFTAYSTVVNIVLCVVLIPPWGMMGAAVAWGAARLLFPALALYRVYAMHGIHPFAAHFLRPLGLSLLILVPIFLFVPAHPSLVLTLAMVAAPFVVFAVAVVVTYSVDPGDVFLLKAAEQRVRLVRPFRRLFESRLAREPPGRSSGGFGP